MRVLLTGMSGAGKSTLVRELRDRDGTLFFAGCSEEQAALRFDVRILLTAPREVLAARLRTRTTTADGREPSELSQVLTDLDAIEPLPRRSADLVLDTATATPGELADRVLAAL